jgi:hypothetical protein
MQQRRALSGGPLLVERWLRRKRATTVALRLLAAVALLVAAAVALGMIFFFTYAVVWFGYNYGVSAISELIFSRRQHISHRTILIICWCFLALLFLTNARVSRDYWTSGSISKSQWSSLWLAGVTGSLVALLVNANASAKTITDLLLTGPRLVGASIRALHGALLLVSADLRTCSDALTLLAGRTSSVSADDLRDSLRCGDPQRILAQLSALGTVLLIRTDPPAVTLNPDLRDHLQHLLQGRAARDSEQSPPQPVTTPPVDPAPYQVLGLPSTASLEEVRAAYRRRMKECHPDIFATHSDEVRQRAEEKTKAIIAAYEDLLARYRNEGREEVAP